MIVVVDASLAPRWHVNAAGSEAAAALLEGTDVLIAEKLDHPVYDCLYLALAERESTHLLTADARLLARLAGSARENLARPLEPMRGH